MRSVVDNTYVQWAVPLGLCPAFCKAKRDPVDLDLE